MAKKITFIDIIKSRYGSEDNLPEFVEERRKICDGCDWNSVNKNSEELTTEHKIWIAANHGKPTCLACKCMISAKTKLPHAVCGLKGKGLAPKWGTIIEHKQSEKLQIQDMSKTQLDIKEEGNEIILKYGTIKIGEDTHVEILVTDNEDKMTDISASASCGCTVPKFQKIGKNISLQIKYDTKRQGEFTKTVVLSYKKNNMDFEKIFKITGKTE